MKQTRLIFLGGFLGAGKTTILIHLAKKLQEKGLKVAVIANDQGSELVDSSFIKANSIPGSEITGGCFCCRFSEFVVEMDRMIKTISPDVLIVEPVGSCADLVSTVFLPLQRNYPGQFSLAPFTVVTDGVLIKKLVLEDSFPFSSKIKYLYQKQMEESSIILINKTDLLKTDETDIIIKYIKAGYPSSEILPFCAASESNYDVLTDLVMGAARELQPLDNMDYAIYGEAEAQLGWYNSSLTFEGREVFDPNDFVEELMKAVHSALRDSGAAVAHFKVMATGRGGTIKASITEDGSGVGFSKKAYDLVKEMGMIMNARVEAEPEQLEDIISLLLERKSREWGLKYTFNHKEYFKPLPPKSTNLRYSR